MKNLDLNEYGVQEMSHSEVKEVDGGSLLVAALVFVAGVIVGAILASGDNSTLSVSVK